MTRSLPDDVKLPCRPSDGSFRENAIDGEVLADLAAEDLRKLGVTVVGDRRKMLTAIGKLSGSSTISLGAKKNFS